MLSESVKEYGRKTCDFPLIQAVNVFPVGIQDESLPEPGGSTASY